MLPLAHGHGRPAAGHPPARRARRGARGRDLLDGVDVVSHQAAVVGAGVTGERPPRVRRPQRPRHRRAAGGDARRRRPPSRAGLLDGGVRRGPLLLPRARPPGPARAVGGRRSTAGDFDNHCTSVCAALWTGTLVDEDARLDPRSAYAASKVAQEHYAVRVGPPGRRRRGRAALPQRLRAAHAPGHAVLRGRGDVPVLPRARRPAHGSSRTAARCATSCTSPTSRPPTSPPSRRSTGDGGFRAYNVCSGEPVSIRDVAELVAQRHGLRTSPRRSPAATASATSGTSSPRPSGPARELGFAARVSPEQGSGSSPRRRCADLRWPAGGT